MKSIESKYLDLFQVDSKEIFYKSADIEIEKNNFLDAYTYLIFISDLYEEDHKVFYNFASKLLEYSLSSTNDKILEKIVKKSIGDHFYIILSIMLDLEKDRVLSLIEINKIINNLSSIENINILNALLLFIVEKFPNYKKDVCHYLDKTIIVDLIDNEDNLSSITALLFSISFLSMDVAAEVLEEIGYERLFSYLPADLGVNLVEDTNFIGAIFSISQDIGRKIWYQIDKELLLKNSTRHEIKSAMGIISMISDELATDLQKNIKKDELRRNRILRRKKRIRRSPLRIGQIVIYPGSRKGYKIVDRLRKYLEISNTSKGAREIINKAIFEMIKIRIEEAKLAKKRLK